MRLMKLRVISVAWCFFFSIILVHDMTLFKRLDYLRLISILRDTGTIILSCYSVSLTPDNPRWVGAWWVGFLISGALAFIVALPIAGFPKSLPGSEQYRKDREQEVYKGKGKKDDCVVDKPVESEEESPLNYKQILKSVKVLVFNPTFMFLNLAAACEGI